MAKSATKPKAPEFTSVLDRPASEIKPPVTMPAGSYLTVVKGLPKFGKAKTGTEFVDYELSVLQALDDVDADELSEVKDLTSKSIRARFFLTEDSVWRLKEFLDNCGIELDEGESLRAGIEMANGCQVVAVMRHEASEDGKRTFARFSGSAPAETEDDDE